MEGFVPHFLDMMGERGLGRILLLLLSFLPIALGNSETLPGSFSPISSYLSAESFSACNACATSCFNGLFGPVGTN